MEDLCLPPPPTPTEVIIDSKEVHILKSGTCPSLSGKTQLDYDFGRGASGEVLVRISKTSGTGYYSNDWAALDHAYRLLQSSGGTVTFSTLLPLFAGKSINTAGFLLAVMKHEGVVQPSPDKARTYQLGDAKPFFAELKALMTSEGGTPKAAPKKTIPAARKVPTKGRTAKRE